MIHLVWPIPALPLAGALINLAFGRRLGRRAHWVAAPAVGLAFVVSLLAFLRVWQGHETFTGPLFDWVVAGTFRAPVTLQLDQLSAVMLLVVTGVGFLIHVYSAGYMHDDPDYPRFFAYLNLFVFSMIMLVLAGNFLLLYVFWEAVGLCSYLLIGFWYTRESAANAGKKAFIVNRDRRLRVRPRHHAPLDARSGRSSTREVFQKAPDLAVGTATAISLLLFLGACGKSAQLPLHVWLPDAMEGPTPVSALIHAATMVTAGVYLVARAHALFERSGVPSTWSPGSASLTAVFAATIGLVQTDIKRVLAYSTVSQLGYMFVGVGVGRLRGGRLPPGHPRVLQGAPVPRGRLGHPRPVGGAGPPEDGRPRPEAPRHLVHDADRHRGDLGPAALLGLLLEGRDPRGRVLRREAGDLRPRPDRLGADRLLHVAPRVPHVPGPLARRPRRGAPHPRVAARHDDPLVILAVLAAGAGVWGLPGEHGSAIGRFLAPGAGRGPRGRGSAPRRRPGRSMAVLGRGRPGRAPGRLAHVPPRTAPISRRSACPRAGSTACSCTSTTSTSSTIG